MQEPIQMRNKIPSLGKENKFTIQAPIQARQRAPSLVKEGLLVALGLILIFCSVILLFVNMIVADIVYILGAILSVVYTVKKYKSFKEQHIISKASIIWYTITTAIFVIVGFFIVLIANLFKFIS